MGKAQVELTPRERWAGRLLMAVGAGALVVAAVLAVRTAQFLPHAVPVTAAIARDLGPASSPVWAQAHPALQFTTREGRRLRVEQHEGGRARVGAPAPILYDARRPETVRHDSFLGVWGGVLFALWLGLGFTLLPLIGPRFGIKADFNV